MNPSCVAKYWQGYLDTLLSDDSIAKTYVAEQFGDTPELADELGHLILDGRKTATCSALWEWEAELSTLPTAGLKTVVLDSAKTPLCIVETTVVRLCPFNEVTADFAYDEGEGDRTLAYWRSEHWRYFARVLPKIGKRPTPDMPLVCEHFQVVYPLASRTPTIPQSTLRNC
ncbi:MAG: ASCH domain-containing protein [Cyanobacteria bacterium P01_H01_bin.58]